MREEKSPHEHYVGGRGITAYQGDDAGLLTRLVVTVSHAENFTEPMAKNMFGRLKKSTTAQRFYVRVGTTSSMVERCRPIEFAKTASVPRGETGCRWGPEDLLLPTDTADKSTSESTADMYGELKVEIWSDRNGSSNEHVLIGRGQKAIRELLVDRDPEDLDTAPYPVSLSLDGVSNGILYLSIATASGRPCPLRDEAEREVDSQHTNSQHAKQNTPAKNEQSRAENERDADDGRGDTQVVVGSDSQADEQGAGHSYPKLQSPKWGMPRLADLKGVLTASLQITRDASLLRQPREKTGTVESDLPPEAMNTSDKVPMEIVKASVVGQQQASYLCAEHDLEPEVNTDDVNSPACQDTRGRSALGLRCVEHGMQSLKDALKATVPSTGKQPANTDEGQSKMSTMRATKPQNVASDYPSEDPSSERLLARRERSSSRHSSSSQVSDKEIWSTLSLEDQEPDEVRSETRQRAVDIRQESNKATGRLIVETIPADMLKGDGRGNGSAKAGGICKSPKDNRVPRSPSPLRSLLAVASSLAGDRGGRQRDEDARAAESIEEEKSPPALVEDGGSVEAESTKDIPESNVPPSLAGFFTSKSSSSMKEVIKSTLALPTFSSRLKGLGRNKLTDGGTSKQTSPAAAEDHTNVERAGSVRVPEVGARKKKHRTGSHAEVSSSEPVVSEVVTAERASAEGVIKITIFRATGLPEILTKDSFRGTKTGAIQGLYVKVKVRGESMATSTVRGGGRECSWGREKEGEAVEVSIAPASLPEESVAVTKLTVEVRSEESEKMDGEVLLGSAELLLAEWLGRSAAWVDLEIKGSHAGRLQLSVTAKGFGRTYQGVEGLTKVSTGTVQVEDNGMLVTNGAIVGSIACAPPEKRVVSSHHKRDSKGCVKNEGAPDTTAENEPEEDPDSPLVDHNGDLGVEAMQNEMGGRTEDRQWAADKPSGSLDSVSNPPRDDVGGTKYVGHTSPGERIDEADAVRDAVGIEINHIPTKQNGEYENECTVAVATIGKSVVIEDGHIEGVAPDPKMMNIAVLVKRADSLAEALAKTTFGRPRKNATQDPYVIVSSCGVKGATSAVVGGGRNCRWSGSAGELVNLAVACADIDVAGWGEGRVDHLILTVEAWNQQSADRYKDVFIGSGNTKLKDSLGRGAIWVQLSRQQKKTGRVKIEVTCAELRQDALIHNQTSQHEQIGQGTELSMATAADSTAKRKGGTADTNSTLELPDDHAKPDQTNSEETGGVRDSIGHKKETETEAHVGPAVDTTRLTCAKEDLDVKISATQGDKLVFRSWNGSELPLAADGETDSAEGQGKRLIEDVGRDLDEEVRTVASSIAAIDHPGTQAEQREKPIDTHLDSTNTRASTEHSNDLQPRRVHGRATPLALSTSIDSPSQHQCPSTTSLDAPIADSAQAVYFAVQDSPDVNSDSSGRGGGKVTSRFTPEDIQLGRESNDDTIESAKRYNRTSRNKLLEVSGHDADVKREKNVSMKAHTDQQSSHDIECGVESNSRQTGSAVKQPQRHEQPARDLREAEARRDATIDEVMSKKRSARRQRARQIARRRREAGLRLGIVGVHRPTHVYPDGNKVNASNSETESRISEAATIIQSAFRGQMTRRGLRLRQRAAAIIQASNRGHRERRIYLGMTARVERARIEERRIQERWSRMASMRQVKTHTAIHQHIHGDMF